MYYFNVMAIPPADDAKANNNTIQLAVRHRMRLVYRPKALFDLSLIRKRKSSNGESLAKADDQKSNALFFYFHSIQIGGKEVKPEVNSVALMTTKEVTLKENINASSITGKLSMIMAELGRSIPHRCNKKFILSL